MRKPSKDSGPTPHAVGALAGVLVFAVGVGLAVYFIEVRGTGVRVEWMSGHGPELAIVGGALLVASLAAHLAIANLAQRLRSSSRHRQLLHHALEVDYADAEVLRRFDSIPDLRELVGLVASEKSQGRELGDRVEALRGELRSLVEGMQRSALDLARMREESTTELGMLAVATFNGLLERTRTAEAALAESETARQQLESQRSEMSIASEDTVYAEPEPDEAPKAAADAQHLTTLVARLDELEDELQRLRTVTAAPPRRTVESSQRTVVPRATTPTWVQPSRVTPSSMASMPVAGLSFEDLQPSPAPPRWNAPATAAPIVGATPPGDMQFPHFVGRPVGPIADRIEVSYETPDGEEVMDLPASALLFEDDDVRANEEPAMDLRSLGALELDR